MPCTVQPVSRLGWLWLVYKHMMTSLALFRGDAILLAYRPKTCNDRGPELQAAGIKVNAVLLYGCLHHYSAHLGNGRCEGGIQFMYLWIDSRYPAINCLSGDKRRTTETVIRGSLLRIYWPPLTMSVWRKINYQERIFLQSIQFYRPRRSTCPYFYSSLKRAMLKAILIHTGRIMDVPCSVPKHQKL